MNYILIKLSEIPIGARRENSKSLPQNEKSCAQFKTILGTLSLLLSKLCQEKDKTDQHHMWTMSVWHLRESIGQQQ